MKSAFFTPVSMQQPIQGYGSGVTAVSRQQSAVTPVADAASRYSSQDTPTALQITQNTPTLFTGIDKSLSRESHNCRMRCEVITEANRNDIAREVRCYIEGIRMRYTPEAMQSMITQNSSAERALVVEKLVERIVHRVLHNADKVYLSTGVHLVMFGLQQGHLYSTDLSQASLDRVQFVRAALSLGYEQELLGEYFSPGLLKYLNVSQVSSERLEMFEAPQTQEEQDLLTRIGLLRIL